MSKPEQKNVSLDKQNDEAVVKIRGVKIFEITNREDEGFIKLQVFDWDGNQVISQSFNALQCIKTLE